MTVTTKSYRKTEAMLLSAGLTCADIMMTMIALACETMTPTPLEHEIAEADPIYLSVSVIANRLDWDLSMANALLRQYNGEALGDFGFNLCNDGEDPECGDITRVLLSDTLTAIVRGTGER